MVIKTLKRAGIGFIIGMAVGNIIALLTGNPHMVVSSLLLERVGSQQTALLLQTLFSGILGAVSFAGVSLYEIDDWPLLRIAFVHYAIIELAYIPIALSLGWVVSAAEVLIVSGINAIVYLIIFFIMFIRYRAEVRELNELQNDYLNKNEEGGKE